MTLTDGVFLQGGALNFSTSHTLQQAVCLCTFSQDIPPLPKLALLVDRCSLTF